MGTKKQKEIKLGSIVRFGNYFENLNGNKTPISWIVIKKDGDKVLLISKFGLDCKPFNDGNNMSDWKDCTLRAWLNKEFYQEAFSPLEAERIIPTEGLKDNVFIIGKEDFNNLLTCTNKKEAKDKEDGKNGVETNQSLISTDNNKSDDEKKKKGPTMNRMRCKCVGTPYCYSRGATKLLQQKLLDDEQEQIIAVDANEKGHCFWWLNLQGHSCGKVADVNGAGDVHAFGHDAQAKIIAVRPSVWIKVEPNQ